MKKLLLVVFFLFPLSCFSMSKAKAIQIYNKLRAANGGGPVIVFSNSKVVNAYGSPFLITVNQGMLDFVGNDEHQLAIVLAHELGHANGIFSGPNNELRADRYGALLMPKAGYNVCRGAKFHKRINNPPSKTHPSSKERVKRLGC